jgi:hypothetical protein
LLIFFYFFLKPGDFVLLRNVNSKKTANLNADTIIRIPGNGAKYGRYILKLASYKADLTALNLKENSEVAIMVTNIKNKAKQFDLDFKGGDEVRGKKID